MAFLAVLAITISGCASDDSTSYPAYENADQDTVASFRATLGLGDPGAEGIPGETAWRLGVETCRQLDDGSSAEDLVLEMGRNGFTGEMAGAVVTASVDVCPHHADTVAEWLGDDR